MPEETVITGSEEGNTEEGKTEESSEEGNAEEQKAAADTKAEDKASEDSAKSEDAKGDEDKKDGAPAEYSDFKMPEGMEVDKAALDTFVPIAKELNLTQEQAQKLVDVYAKGAKNAMETHVKIWDDLKSSWRDEAKADKEIGGEHFDNTVKYASLALKKVGTDALGQALEVTGVGDHPEVIRFFARVGKMIDSDTVDLGNVLGEGPRDPAKIMFPDQN